MIDTHTIDAKGRSLGRVASEAAKMLRGKGSVAFQRHIMPTTKVVIENASLVTIGEAKLDDKMYYRHSHHAGGQKALSMRQYIEKKGYPELLRKVVMGMIPDNRLADKIIKNLTVTD